MTKKNNYKYCLGISSKTEDNKHIIMIDYDNIEYVTIIDELRGLQLDHELSDFYILKSNNGHNAICLDKFTIDELITILRDSNFIDIEYLKIAIKRGYFVTRIGVDKKLIQRLFGFNRHTKSYAHRLFLYNIYMDKMNETINEYNHYDDYKNYTMVAYESEKHGYLTYEDVKNMKFKTIKEYKHCNFNKS